MSVFRFLGFSIGADVDVTATQGTKSDRATVNGWGQAAATPITLSLAATRLTGTAPAGIQFTATATSPAARVTSPFHDIEYVWSFDDPGAYRYLDKASLWGTERNVAYGPVVSHVFSAPGTYIVTCTVHDGENPPKSETIEIVVANPNAVFPGTSTAVVSLSGNFAGAPSGANLHTSIAAAVAALAGRQNQRLLLRRGETYTSGFEIDEAAGSGKRILVGAFGTGDNPLIDKSASGSSGTGIQFDITNGVADEIMVRDIDFLGSYDCTSAMPDTSGGESLVDFKNFDSPFSAHKTVWGCHIKNAAGQAVDASTSAATPMENIFIGDCWLDGWRSYGMLLADAGTIGWCGVKAVMPTGTRNGPDKALFQGYDWPDHGPIRVSRPTGPATFHNCDLTSFADWSSAGSDTVASKYSMNPAIRWNTGGVSGTDQKLNVDRVRAEGYCVQPINITNKDVRTNVFALIDRLYCVLSSHQNAGNGHGGTTWRNCILVCPNTIPGSSTGLQGAPLGEPGEAWLSGIDDSNARRMECYSCAWIDLRDDVNAQRRDDAKTGTVANTNRDYPPILNTSISDVYIANNLQYAPNRGPTLTGFTAHNPLNTTAGTWSPRYDGERWLGNALDSSAGYGAETVSTFRPLTGSPAIGGALGKVSLLDFEGNLRSEVLAGLTRSTPSVGPYEPDLES